MRMCWDFFKRSKSKDADKEKWKKRQNQTQSSGLKQREGGKGLSRILIMHTRHTYTHRHPYQQTPVISPQIQLCWQSELSPWWSGRCEVNSKALRGDLDFTQTHRNICSYTLFLSQSCTIIIVRTHSAHNLMLIDHTETTQYFCPCHIAAYISICVHTYCENSWASILQEHTHIFRLLHAHTCHMQPPMHSPWQKYLSVSPQSICTRTDWVAHTHKHRHTGAHKHAKLDNWWRAVYCSRWTLSKLTSGSGRINYSIKSHQDHTTWWMLKRSGRSQLSALQFTQTWVNFFPKRNHLVVFIF